MGLWHLANPWAKKLLMSQTRKFKVSHRCHSQTVFKTFQDHVHCALIVLKSTQNDKILRQKGCINRRKSQSCWVWLYSWHLLTATVRSRNLQRRSLLLALHCHWMWPGSSKERAKPVVNTATLNRNFRMASTSWKHAAPACRFNINYIHSCIYTIFWITWANKSQSQPWQQTDLALMV